MKKYDDVPTQQSTVAPATLASYFPDIEDESDGCLEDSVIESIPEENDEEVEGIEEVDEEDTEEEDDDDVVDLCPVKPMRTLKRASGRSSDTKRLQYEGDPLMSEPDSDDDSMR